MAWIAVFDIHEPYIFDDQTGERIATFHKYKNMHEPPDHAWSRACVAALAPELHHALADLTLHAKHQFSQDLLPVATDCDKLLNQVKESYDNRTKRN